VNNSSIGVWQDAVRANWLWFVWAGIAVCVVVGYFVVRRRLHRVEAAGDGPSPAVRARHAAEHAAEHARKKRRGVE
jgi:hypothetical protein